MGNVKVLQNTFCLLQVQTRPTRDFISFLISRRQDTRVNKDVTHELTNGIFLAAARILIRPQDEQYVIYISSIISRTDLCLYLFIELSKVPICEYQGGHEPDRYTLINTNVWMRLTRQSVNALSVCCR